MNIKNSLAIFILKLEMILLGFCILIGSLEFIYRIQLKSEFLADSIRNDFILQDQKAVLQKFQMAIIAHGFESIDIRDINQPPDKSFAFPLIIGAVPILSNPEEPDSSVLVLMEYSYSALTGLANGLYLWFALTFLIFALYPFIKKNLETFVYREIELQKTKEVNQIILEVAHDIRSPLSALNSLVHSINDIKPDAKEIMLQVSKRINSIADDLIVRLGESQSQSELLKSYTERTLLKNLSDICEEKSIENDRHKNIRIELKSENLDPLAFVLIPDKDLSRVLSNIINNSAEAMEYNGVITVQSYSTADSAIINIFDSGRGISEDILSKTIYEQTLYKKTWGRNGPIFGTQNSHEIRWRVEGLLKSWSRNPN